MPGFFIFLLSFFSIVCVIKKESKKKMKVIGIIWSVVQVFKLEAVDYKDKQILSSTTVIQVNLKPCALSAHLQVYRSNSSSDL